MRMNCRKVLSRLHAYLDGEVPAELMHEFEEHLSICPSCRDQVERIRQISDILDSLTVPPLPEEFVARVMAVARKRSLPVPEKRPVLGIGRLPLHWFADLSAPMRLAACAMVLLACLLGMFMSRDLSLSGISRANVADAENLDGFEWFSPTPPASLGNAYLTLALTTPEDRGSR
jgi:anti-sigma factor (TIGR02949 family)